VLQKAERARELLRQGRALDARLLATQITQMDSGFAEGWVLMARANAQLGDFEASLSNAQKALAIDGAHPVAFLISIEAYLGCGLVAEALEVAARLENERKNDPSVILQVGYCYTRTNHHAEAARCYERVLILQPNQNVVLHNLAGAYLALGQSDRAERLYTDLLRREPTACECYYNRATIKKQTAQHNHIPELQRVLAAISPGGWGETPVCYALAKEYEDLGEWEKSFAVLKRGADALRKQLRYDVEADLQHMEALRSLFDKSASSENGNAAQPIFIVGMPRTGTTLVDRILSSHSRVASIGESDEFRRALLRQARGSDGKLDLGKLAEANWSRVGLEFDRAAHGLQPNGDIHLDKTLSNFLYVGAILRAFPKAHIIHVRRNPMDSCYAIYKNLFRNGLEYSYDLRDIGRYYLGYRMLMEHWQNLFGEKILTIDYENLVASQEDVTRRMVSFCGLPWEDACLTFEKNQSPSFTASLTQIRNPIYTSSVRLWQHYEAGLAPLRRILEEGGCSAAD
jgi:tetratricopeptide (TPR) repeat protein